MIIAEIFDKGGIVVWVLSGYSLLALSIIFERLLRFAMMGKLPQAFEKNLVITLKQGKLDDWLGAYRGPEVAVLTGISQAAAAGVKDLTRVAVRIGSSELQRMECGFRSIEILGNTAPLLGLLGTIFGMIKAFMVIETAGGKVDAQALAGGIWEAMITTGVGLSVAIPILLMLHLLEGMADRRAHSMRSLASVLLEQLPHNEIQGEGESEAIHHREVGIHAV
ncbi:MAG: MotA/TolQ/ExbB proton channel family protein [Gammaproteobacteria bacterium]|nr:MotA/TolQ/ExbB proton channel family protein [Gammaproteobacteria bacterium]